MKITDLKKVATFDFSELVDGLFTFALQGRYVLDMCAMHAIEENEDSIYQIDIYEHKSKKCTELCNFSHLTKQYATEFGMFENYDQIETHAFTTEAEAYAFYLSKMIELNNF